MESDAALNASSVQSESIGLIESELLQLKQQSQLDSEVDQRLDSFIALDAQAKESILSSLVTEEKSATAAEWGFLKNIVNIDRFFSSGSSADTSRPDAPAPKVYDTAGTKDYGNHDYSDEDKDFRDKARAARARAIQKIRNMRKEQLLKGNEAKVNRVAKEKKEAELRRAEAANANKQE